MAHTIKATSLGVGLPAVVLMKVDTGFIVATTKTYPKDLKGVLTTTERSDAETAYANAVNKMMAEEEAEVKRLNAAGCNA